MNTQIETRVVSVDRLEPDRSVMAEAGQMLRAGLLVVIPTETVYGIAADAFNPRAVARLRSAKLRPDTKPLPLMVVGAEELDEYAIRIPDAARALAERFWPGPLTLVLYAGDRVGEGIHAGTARVGLRAPDNAVAQAVLEAARRPLALTSANLAYEPPATTAAEALAALEGRVDLILDSGPCEIGKASSVLDMTRVPPAILRAGALSAADLGLSG